MFKKVTLTSLVIIITQEAEEDTMVMEVQEEDLAIQAVVLDILEVQEEDLAIQAVALDIQEAEEDILVMEEQEEDLAIQAVALDIQEAARDIQMEAPAIWVEIRDIQEEELEIIMQAAVDT
jgi:hypothetical protein